MHAFITVGSTQFDALVDAVLSTAVLDALRERGYSTLAIQCGNYEGEHQNIATGADGVWRMYKQEVAVEMWRYRPSLSREFEAADLVISHAGMFASAEAIANRIEHSSPWLCRLRDDPRCAENEKVDGRSAKPDAPRQPSIGSGGGVGEIGLPSVVDDKVSAACLLNTEV